MKDIGNETGPIAPTSSSAMNEVRNGASLLLDGILFSLCLLFLYSMSIFVLQGDLNSSIGAISSENKSYRNNRS